MIHHVSLIERGECLYAWLDMLVHGSTICFAGEFQEFPFPIDSIPSLQFKKISNQSKSGSLQSINAALKKTDCANLIEKNLAHHFNAKNFNEKCKQLPQKIKTELDVFFQNDQHKPAAFIHIRHLKATNDRNLTCREFNFLIRMLEEEGYEQFVIFGDFYNISNEFKQRINDNSKKFFFLHYLDKNNNGDYSEAKWFADWLKGCKPLAKQIQLIKLIREQYPWINLLIGRKSGCGVDLHAYAGMPSIFLENDKQNDRYAPLIDKKWGQPYVSHLIPVFFPNNNESAQWPNFFKNAAKRSDVLKEIQAEMKKAITTLCKNEGSTSEQCNVPGNLPRIHHS